MFDAGRSTLLSLSLIPFARQYLHKFSQLQLHFAAKKKKLEENFCQPRSIKSHDNSRIFANATTKAKKILYSVQAFRRVFGEKGGKIQCLIRKNKSPLLIADTNPTGFFFAIMWSVGLRGSVKRQFRCCCPSPHNKFIIGFILSLPPSSVVVWFFTPKAMTIKKRGGGELVVGWGLCWVGGWGAVVEVGVVRMYSLVLKGKRALSQKKEKKWRQGVRRNTQHTFWKGAGELFFIKFVCSIYKYS